MSASFWRGAGGEPRAVPRKPAPKRRAAAKRVGLVDSLRTTANALERDGLRRSAALMREAAAEIDRLNASQSA